MQFAPPVDLSRFLDIPLRQRIAAIGIELEGGWLELPKGVGLARDTSVRGLKIPPDPALSARYQELGRRSNDHPLTPNQADEFRRLHAVLVSENQLQTGELPSPKIALTVDRKPSKDWEVWVKKFHPSHVNGTCGMHVHMSFARPYRYQRLMVPSFPSTVVEEFAKWAISTKLPGEHPLWSRLAGTSEYCQHKFYADLQASTTEKDYDHHRPGCRYTVINYCWGRYKTIECRLLPMFEKPEDSIAAIKHLLWITNAFLRATSRREEKLRVDTWVDPDPFIEESTECV